MSRRSQRLVYDRRGVSSIEYALLLFGILIVVAGGYRALGRKNVKPASASERELRGGEGYVASGGAGGSAGGGQGASGGGSFGSQIVCDGRSCGGGPGSNCFAAGTPVWTPRGERPIESIAAGDIVFSRDEDSRAIRRQRVVRTFARRASALVEVAVAGEGGKEDTLRVTAEHRFWTADRSWVEAETLVKGEPLVDAAGEVVRVVSVKGIAGEATVYNFEVEETHTYFVGHTGTWVHNACDPIKPVFQQLTNGANPSVATQTFVNAFSAPAGSPGALPANGVGTFTINPQTGAITPQQPSWFGPSTFNGQYLGLLTPPDGDVPHDIDPNAPVVFTDNLTGCAVAISQTNPPQVLHMLSQNLGDNPQTYQANIEPYMTLQGMSPHGDPAHGIPPPLLVQANNYGWVVGGGDYGPGMNNPHNSQAFLYGVQDPATGQRQWWLLQVGARPEGGYQQSTTFVGTTRH